MSTDELDDLEETSADATAEQEEPLKLDVKVESPSACERHITVTIPRDDIDRYFDKAFSEMMESAAVPGFRAGRAPRKLVEARYRKDVKDQVKGSLLMDSMAQVNEEQNLAAISEPDINPEAIEVPDDGPMTFEFDLEVRPEFDLPQWKGLKLERPSGEFAEDEVQKQLERMLANHGRRVPTDEPAQLGDYITAKITAEHGGQTINEIDEESMQIRSTLSFRDGALEKFDDLMKGVEAGDRREATLRLSKDATNEELAGEDVGLTFEVLDVKKFELPELTEDVLKEFGNYESEADLRDAIRDSLTRRRQYEQQQRARQQITRLLTEAAQWELPQEMLKRQSERELERSVLELQRSGFPEDAIQAHVNELRQNSQAETARALREHFILERIAEVEEIDATDGDYDHEISLIAFQSGDTPRRVRAQVEKRGLWDSLRNQIVERKVIELVLEHAKFQDVKYEAESDDVAAVDVAVAGGDQPEIPVAKYAEAGELAEPKDHT